MKGASAFNQLYEDSKNGKCTSFIIIPKVSHPWFDEVNKGAQAQAEILSRGLGVEIVVDYMPPSVADVIEQTAILEKAASSRPSGIAVDPVDAVGHMTALNRIRGQGIPVVLFDSPSPDSSITSVGNNFSQQGIIAAERLAKLIGCAGKVAVMTLLRRRTWIGIWMRQSSGPMPHGYRCKSN